MAAQRSMLDRTPERRNQANISLRRALRKRVGMGAADLAQLMSINDVHASQKNLLRHRQLVFHPFREVVFANVQLSRE
jgi:hypothetical protein